MTPGDSVSHWLGELQAGNQAAAQPLWEKYFHRLVRLARAKLRGQAQRAADGEDVALSAFHSFCQRAQEGRFPQLQDRDDLWRLLVTITARKALNLVRDEQAQKRGGGAVLGESALLGPESARDDVAGLEQVLSREPTPAFAAQVADEYRRLLDRLGDDELRSIVLWKLEGYTNEEIARKLGCVLRTIERRLRVVRCLWDEETGP